jgi:hypothetical protein
MSRDWRCHAHYVDDFKPEAGDPLHKPAEGSLVGQFGAKGGPVRAGSDLAVVELRAQRTVCLAAETDLICEWSHGYASQLVVDTCCQRPWAAESASSPDFG